MKLKIDIYIITLWLVILLVISILNTPTISIGAGLKIDKLAHFILYGITTLLLFRALRKTTDNKKPMFYAFIFSCIYGLIIELIQTLTPQRRFESADILANTLGSLTTIIGIGLYQVITKRNTHEKLTKEN